MYSKIEIATESDKIIEDPKIDLIIIVAPNEFHYPLARKAFFAGKHVVVDKPFIVTSSKASNLIQLTESKNLLLSVYHNRRFASNFFPAKKIINSKRLFRIVEVIMNFNRFKSSFNGNWREDLVPGSGILYDLGSHLIDQSIVFFGLPEFITPDLKKQRRGKAIDYFDFRDISVYLK